MYGTYNGSLKAFRARFSITTTTTAMVAMSIELKTRSGSHYRVYVTFFSLHLAVLAEGALTLAEGAFETPSESRRVGSGCLSIRKLTRHHPVVGHPLIH